MILLYYEGNKNAIYNKTTVDIHSLVNYPLNMHLSDSHPALLVVVPKIHEKAIIHLEPDEIAILLDNIESYGDTLSGHKKAYYEKTKTRDLAIVTLYDTIYYAATNSDVLEVVGADQQMLLNHYLEHGINEGRLPYAGAVANTASGNTTDGLSDAGNTFTPVPMSHLANLSSLQKRHQIKNSLRHMPLW